MFKKRVHRIIIAFFTVLLTFSLTLQFPQAKQKKTIRVGMAMQSGLSMKDDKNNYYGYDYDYLMQIAQYTGWEYEFVEVEGDINQRLTKLLNMLENGEIDIMGAMKYSEKLEEVYDYPSEPYGYSYNVLRVNDKNEIYDFNTLTHKKDLKIAVLKTAAKRIQKLDQFASANGFAYTKVFCNSEDDLANAVTSGKADALLEVDLIANDHFNNIVKFSPDPFYFAVSKGKSEIVAELNQALNNIQQNNPTLSSNLYNRYFSGINTFVLSKKEEEFIQSKKTINVLVKDGAVPIQYTLNKKASGVGADVLNFISRQSNLECNFIVAKTSKEYKNYLDEGDIDVLLGVTYDADYAASLNAELTNPYLSTSMQLVTNKAVSPSKLNGKTLGVNEDASANINYADGSEKMKIYDTPEEILKAIDSGEADYTYLNKYLVTYYMNKHRFKNLSFFSAPDYMQSQFSFAILNHNNQQLKSILNKGIRASQDDITTYIYKNGYVESGFDLIKYTQDHPLMAGSITLLTLAVIIFSILLYYKRQLQIKQEMELEYQRFQKLSEISGEMTFTYDYRKDELKISKFGIHQLAEVDQIPSFAQGSQLSNHALEKILYYLKQENDVNDELELQLLDQEEKWYRLIIKVIKGAGKEDQSYYAVGRVKDIQKDVEEREILLRKSITDSLTGIYNRRGIIERIEEGMQGCSSNHALILLDLDNFKVINDTYGHLEGDKVLCQTAEMLKKIFLNSPVGRLGGDEFIIFIQNTSEREVAECCSVMLDKINHIPFVEKHHLSLSMSAGIVMTTYSCDVTELIRFADESMYHVKKSGRNGYYFYHENM